MYCGNDDELFPSCEQCPRTKNSIAKSWCGGNCRFDSVYQVCKEGNWPNLFDHKRDD